MTASKIVSEHAKALSALGASKGGIARAEGLTPEERSAIARRAAEERWATTKGLPRETHTGILKIGQGIPCSVLDNEMRVFSVNGLLRAFGSGAKGRVQLSDTESLVPSFLAAANVRPFISDELMRQIVNPVAYRSMTGGRPAYGYEARIIRKLCDVMLDARSAGVLRLPQLPIARAAEALVRAFADVGIISLIDEATGYQYDRASYELRRLIEAYVVEDMRPWAKLFPDAFFRQVYRIHGWQYKPGVTQGPRYVGKFINKYVYSRLPPPVLDKLRALSPAVNNRRKYQLHRFLNEEIGEPTVDRHLASVITLMSVASEKTHFDNMFKVAFPAIGEQTVMRAVINHPQAQGLMEPEETLDSPTTTLTDELEPVDPILVDGIPISDAVGGVRERIMAAMRGRDAIRSTELAKLVYGDDSEPTMSRLRVRLHQYKMQGLVESPSRGFWRLR